LKIIFLGTGAAVPTAKRNVPAVALYFKLSGTFWLFDCGEGTQQQIKKSSLKMSCLEKIFISHFHGDHVFGLPGLLSTRGLEGITKPVTIYAPEGMEQFIESNKKITNFHLTYELRIARLAADLKAMVHEDEDYTVKSAVLRHSIQTFGFSVERKPRYRLMIEKVRAAGVPEGRDYGRLKNGETVKLEDGREVNGRDFLEKIDNGRKFTYCGDTTYCRNSVELAAGSDVLVHESTFSKREEALAKRNMHSTVEDACRVAKEAGVKTLILTHLSPRYENNRDEEGAYSFSDLCREAEGYFSDVRIASDFMEYEIP